MFRKKTNRGFNRIEFTDRYGVECHLQESSLATERAIWLGCSETGLRALVPGSGWKSIEDEELKRVFQATAVIANTCMHLTQKQAAALIPLLQMFVDTGELEEEEKKEEQHADKESRG